MVYSCIIAAVYIINDDEEHEIDDWLHHKQHIKGLHLNGFPYEMYGETLKCHISPFLVPNKVLFRYF